MHRQATPRSAAAVGAVAGLLLVMAGPAIDGPGASATVWLIVCAAAIGIPSYIYVLGISPEDRRGLWVMNPQLLKRAGAFLLAAASVVALASACLYAIEFVRVDRCLDDGGRWNYERQTCER